jgi:GDP-L-fucose synthase
MIERTTKVFVAGHRGVVGAAIVRALEERGCERIVVRTRQELDLADRAAVEAFFAEERPELVILAAAKVGGIAANMAAPVDFLVENLRIQDNVLLACQKYGVAKTAFLGSSCIYPREAPQPMKEEYFMHGPLEPTNESYAVAKIAGIRLSQALHEQYGMNVICPMPCNVYGKGDHFEFERSHVVSALVRRFSEAVASKAPTVTLWGTGSARREFVFTDDLADALLFLLQRFDSPDIINVGTGVDFSIKELAERIAALVGFEGEIAWDATKPDGMPQKLLDVSKLHELGWRHSVDIDEGLAIVAADFADRYAVTESAGSR